MKKYAVIVAGGSGTRMGSSIPKQFLLVNNYPILMHTLLRFIEYPEKIEIILVLPSDQMEQWKKLCTQHNFNHPIKIVNGGNTRFQSVKNGLNAIDDSEGLVAIQDGVRPFATQKIIGDAYALATKHGSAIASVPLKDSIRSVDSLESSRSEDRTRFRLIQTPQTFQLKLIKEAFEFPEQSIFTDDASVYEAWGGKIYLSEGSYENIKITSPEDLIFAEAILKNFRY